MKKLFSGNVFGKKGRITTIIGVAVGFAAEIVTMRGNAELGTMLAAFAGYLCGQEDKNIGLKNDSEGTL